jgi:hypothetical protein
MSSQKPRKEQETKSATEKVRKVKERLKDPNVVHKVCTITSSRGKLCIQEIGNEELRKRVEQQPITNPMSILEYCGGQQKETACV